MRSNAVLSMIVATSFAAVVASAEIAHAAPAPQGDATAHHASSARHAKSRAAKKSAPKHSVIAARPAKAETKVAPKAIESSEAEPQVTIERASTKHAPKASHTPLPTIAVATAKPLIAPIDVRHAAEPARTPVILKTHDAPKIARREKPPCLHAPVDVTRGNEEESFALTKCDGSPAPLAVDTMSILVRPGATPAPKDPVAELAKKQGAEVAPGIKRIDARLVERLQRVVDHFTKDGKAPKMFVVSGYRPSSKGSFHATGRAIDFRLEGVENTDLVAFCKTLDDTGCGFYPNSSFIHIDVRDAGTGHVSWIDASKPGEKPQYVASWPPKADEDDSATASNDEGADAKDESASAGEGSAKEEAKDPEPTASNDATDPLVHDTIAVKLLGKLDELAFLPKGDSAKGATKSDLKADDAKPTAVLAKKIDDGN
jgi:hypothetical protein